MSAKDESRRIKGCRSAGDNAEFSDLLTKGNTDDGEDEGADDVGGDAAEGDDDGGGGDGDEDDGAAAGVESTPTAATAGSGGNSRG